MFILNKSCFLYFRKFGFLFRKPSRMSSSLMLVGVCVIVAYLTIDLKRQTTYLQDPDLLFSMYSGNNSYLAAYQKKIIPTMARERIKFSIKEKRIDIESSLRINSSNKYMKFHRVKKKHTDNVPRPSNIIEIEEPLNFMKNLGEIAVNACNTQNAFEKHNDPKCLNIHYYNPPSWISRNALQNCKYQCYLTAGANYKSASAVIFHTSNKVKAPPAKPNGQIWILHALDAPVLENTDYHKWKLKVNWTLSYRRDSDIVQTYALLQRREIELDVVRYIQSMPWSWQNKTGGAAWFESQCQTHSSRSSYVKKLAKFQNIDIFGKCGTLQCPNQKWKNCNSMINKIYKFSLLFENALCADYITGEVFNSFVDMLFVIPVVRGFTNYSLYLPPKSFIGTQDFKTISSLAKYMDTLAVNKSMIEKYFLWWKKLTFIRNDNAMCEVCKRLHQAYKYHRLYDDIGTWIKGDYLHRRMCHYARDL